MTASGETALLPVYRIRPLPLSYTKQDMGSFTYRYNNGISMDMPLFAWYIEGGSQRILVDTGANAEQLRQYRGLEADDIDSFEDALSRKTGLKPTDIELVIQTHLMFHHCANTRKCSSARVVVQESELEFALAPHPILAPLYVRESFMGLSFDVVNGFTEILPGIELLPVPGQSPGCQAVSVNTVQGKVIISGLCTIEENFNPRAGVRERIPVIPPGMHLNAVEAFNSVLRIKGIADVVIPVHDPGLVNVDSIP